MPIFHNKTILCNATLIAARSISEEFPSGEAARNRDAEDGHTGKDNRQDKGNKDKEDRDEGKTFVINILYSM